MNYPRRERESETRANAHRSAGQMHRWPSRSRTQCGRSISLAPYVESGAPVAPANAPMCQGRNPRFISVGITSCLPLWSRLGRWRADISTAPSCSTGRRAKDESAHAHSHACTHIVRMHGLAPLTPLHLASLLLHLWRCPCGCRREFVRLTDGGCCIQVCGRPTSPSATSIARPVDDRVNVVPVGQRTPHSLFRTAAAVYDDADRLHPRGLQKQQIE
jgi:hypothetical protein